MRKWSMTGIAVLVIVAVAGCSSAAQLTPSGTPSPTSSPSTVAPTPTPTHSSTTPVASGQPTPAPAVIRSDAPPASDLVSARAATFTTAVSYPTGLVVRVDSIKQQTITAQGPGALTGKPSTTFTIRFTNNSTKAVDLSQVVVSAFFGRPQQPSEPVYTGGQNDFSGTLAPGRSMATGYAFSIPVQQLGSVTLTVDFGGIYKPAVFYGAARS